jgi:hypothetical protein
MTLNKLSLSPSGEISNGTITANGQSVGSSVDALNYQSVAVQVTGTFSATLTYQISNDGVNWVTKTLITSANASASTITAAGMAAGDIGGRYFRVVATTYSSGTAVVTLQFNGASQANVIATQAVSGTVTSNLGTGGTGATSLGKAEDAVHASGDTGVFVLAVRAPTTPASPTSAAGDYGSILVDLEGKLLISGTGAPELTIQTQANFTTTSSAALRSAAGSGIRTYLTDLYIENTGATEARFFLLDGATTVASFTVPAKNTLVVSPVTPFRGSANTAWNGQLGVAGTVTVSFLGYTGI